MPACIGVTQCLLVLGIHFFGLRQGLRTHLGGCVAVAESGWHTGPPVVHLKVFLGINPMSDKVPWVWGCKGQGDMV